MEILFDWLPNVRQNYYLFNASLLQSASSMNPPRRSIGQQEIIKFSIKFIVCHVHQLRRPRPGSLRVAVRVKGATLGPASSPASTFTSGAMSGRAVGPVSVKVSPATRNLNPRGR